MTTCLKGKGKAKQQELKIDPDIFQRYATHLEGSLDNAFYVMCRRENGTLVKSRILSSRLAKDYTNDTEKCQSSYQYYIHYQKEDRRNDQWVPYSRITKTKERIEKTKHKKRASKKDLYINSQNFNMNQQQIIEHQQLTKFKTIPRIQIGKYLSDTWYFSPFPVYYHNADCLYFCQFCLSFFILQSQLRRHSEQCPLFHPPGDQIYRDEEQNVAIFQIDGRKNAGYCENLSFLSKLFLDHKNIEWDTSIFLFYVLCQIQDNQYHIAGYFSKQKDSKCNNNLSCILVLPFKQRKGYGKLLIDFSYQLSKIEGKFGSPERPLSDLGLKTYEVWWSQTIISFLLQNKGKEFKIESIKKETGIAQVDIRWTLSKLKILRSDGDIPCLYTKEEYLKEKYKQFGRENKVYKDKIHWVPYKQKWVEGSQLTHISE